MGPGTASGAVSVSTSPVAPGGGRRYVLNSRTGRSSGSRSNRKGNRALWVPEGGGSEIRKSLRERHRQPEAIRLEPPEKDGQVRQVDMHGAVIGTFHVGHVRERIERRAEERAHRRI